MRRCVWLLPLPLLSLAFAPAPFPRAARAKGGHEGLQGTWVLVRREFQGKWDGPLQIAAVIKGNRFTFLDWAAKPISTWSLVIDPKGTPERFDMKDLARPTSSMYGVYSLKDDTLTMCSTWQGKRPLDFDSGKHLRTLDVFKRLKR